MPKRGIPGQPFPLPDQPLLAVAAVLLLAASPMSLSTVPDRGEVALASVTEEGEKQNHHGQDPSLSADGTKVAFKTGATNLDPRDTDALLDLYVKDLVTGKLILATTTAGGIKANGDNFRPSLSEDGTKVAFESLATNLDPRDTDPGNDVYVKDLVTGEITLASTADDGTKGNDASWEPSISGAGRRVAFTSRATNLDPNDPDELGDTYVKDLTTGAVTLASTSSRGVKANGGSDSVDLSGDGKRVAFGSVATNLHPQDRDVVKDIFVKDLVTQRIHLASVTAFGVKANSTSDYPGLSAAGFIVAFHTAATNLDPRDTEDEDVYVKDLMTGALTLASTSPAGKKGNEYSTFASLSADGSRVAFSTGATNLHRVDRDSVTDVYIKDLSTGVIYLASTSEFGSKGNGTSGIPDLSGGGGIVSFDSKSDNLHPGDDDGAYDVYVKRSA